LVLTNETPVCVLALVACTRGNGTIIGEGKDSDTGNVLSQVIVVSVSSEGPNLVMQEYWACASGNASEFMDRMPRYPDGKKIGFAGISPAHQGVKIG
jgi:hypothetical protein